MLVAVTDESLSDLAKEKATAEFTLSPLNRKEKLLCSVLKQIKNQSQMRKMVKCHSNERNVGERKVRESSASLSYMQMKKFHRLPF